MRCDQFIKQRLTRSAPVNLWVTKLYFGLRAMLTRLKVRIPYAAILDEESVVDV